MMMDIRQLLNRLQIEHLTPMQEKVRAAYTETDNLIVLSPTGSGKTLAYLIPLVESLLVGIPGVQAVIVTPSRELALQTEGVFKAMGTPFKAMSCYGGRPAMDEHRTMRSLSPSVIIATPGRLNDHLRKQNIGAATVRILVIDEFDKCLELGFQDEMSAIVSQLPALRKRVLLSATDAAELPLFVGMSEGETVPTRVQKLDYLQTGDVASRLHLRLVASPEKDKLETLYRLLCALGDTTTLVFVNYRESVERVGGYLMYKRFPVETFHGGMEQADRERALAKFRNGSCPVLVSTDLAARGLDIAGVDNVIHYHLPVNQEAFIHRNGRTARWEAAGDSYLIVHSGETLPGYVPADIPRLDLPDTLPPPPKPRRVTLYIGKGKKDKINKVDIVGFLYKKGGLAREDVGQVEVKDHCAFVAVSRSKARQLLNLVAGEKIKGMKTLIEVAK